MKGAGGGSHPFSFSLSSPPPLYDTLYTLLHDLFFLNLANYALPLRGLSCFFSFAWGRSGFAKIVSGTDTITIATTSTAVISF